MNLKLPALIFFASTLIISLPTSLAQEAKHDHLDKMRAALHDLAQTASTLDVVPANSSDLNEPRKRKEPELPRVIFYVCAEPMLRGRCEKLSSKRGFCCTLLPFPLYLPRIHNTFPPPSPPPPKSHGINNYSLFQWYACCNIYLTTIIIIIR